ncbi:MAG: hypothetical protein A2909_02650 [Candidatus Tagabacteria bacterium RIFCSPLOWO2_01_FULL_39_11]|uniref:DUF458 domain-containing protein n=1 Tax=Candidatus Tagabacteria bacterium RIFCSPLOWO2_01_FULL_39_11 TaxID=1802295 RepID=A0A1G2LR13_9BACT|nr:MAG: hypothetical protein A2909_02650 [Candidatus Tagabacteria bacterium RIFCSPLOWO2_01_FULL_39_11]
MKGKFFNITLNKNLNFDELVRELIFYIKEDTKAKYKIVVGTDSLAQNHTQFVSAVTVLRVGRGGRYFWSKSEKEHSPNLRDRIYKETMYSITLAQELKSRLKDFVGEEAFWDNEIVVHIDVGENGPTRGLIESVVGMVKGYGLTAAVKPESFGAFVVADRHVHSFAF